MFKCVLLASFGASIDGLQVSEQRKYVIDADLKDTCTDTAKTDAFFTSMKGDSPANGQRVGQWREMYPSWSFMVEDDADSTCMLQGDKLTPDQSGVQVVIDNDPRNELSCCKSGEKPANLDVFHEGVLAHNINFTKFTFEIDAGDDHPAKNYFYEVAVPEKCQPGGSKAPCPMLVSLHGMALDHMPHMALGCSGCMDDMGVVTAMLYMPDAVTHDPQTGEPVINLVWDSGMWVGEKYVRKVTKKVMQDYSSSIDTNRVYIFGLSMGGAGAFMSAITQPDLFSEVFVVSPTSMVRHSEGMTKRAADEWKPLYAERKGSKKLNQIRIYQGGDDMNGEDIDWDLLPQIITSAGLEKEPMYVEYRMYPVLPHDCWIAAFEDVYDHVWKGA